MSNQRPPAELEFAILCARTAWDLACERQAAALAAKIDWRLLLREAAWHGLLPFVFRRLQQVGPWSCPPEVFAELRTLSLGIAIRNNHLWRQLSQVIERLEGAAVQVVVLKGLVLSHQIWGDIETRASCDLDLLVRPEDIERALHCVHELGFAPVGEAAAGWLPEQLRIEQEIHLWKEAAQTEVDLHWRLHRPNYRMSPRTEELWERAGAVEINGQRFDTLGLSDNLMFLAMHAAKHDWSAARWLVDIAELLRGNEVDWDGLGRRCREWSTVRLWHATLQICTEWLQLPLPAAVEAEVLADPGAQRLAAEVGRRWRLPAPTEEPRPPLPWRRLFFRALDSRADRVRLVFDFWAKPSVHDWKFCPLPRPLWPLYAAIRPLRAVTQGAALRKYLGRTNCV